MSICSTEKNKALGLCLEVKFVDHFGLAYLSREVLAEVQVGRVLVYFS